MYNQNFFSRKNSKTIFDSYFMIENYSLVFCNFYFVTLEIFKTFYDNMYVDIFKINDESMRDKYVLTTPLLGVFHKAQFN